MNALPKVKKIILVSARHHPLHRVWEEVAREISSRVNVELEVREEDYIFLNQYGEKDEYGLAWLPQLFAELEGGRIILLLSKMPLDHSLKPDKEQAIKEALSKLEGNR